MQRIATVLLLALLTLGIGDKSQRPRPERIGEPVESPHEWQTVDFDCEPLTVCWQDAGFGYCAEDVTLVPTGLPEFGSLSIASAAPCVSDEEPSFLLRFDPPMDTIVVFGLTRHPDSDRDRVRLDCWRPGDIIGDPATAVVIEPPYPMEFGEVRPEGRLGGMTQFDGVAACRVYGILGSVSTPPAGQ